MENRSSLKPAVQLLNTLQAEISECQISVYAGNAAFFLSLSALPLATLLMGVLQYLPGETAGFLENALQILPQDTAAFLRYLLAVGDPITVASISAIAALWAASRGIYGMMRGLNRAFRMRETRGWIHAKAACMKDTLLLLTAFPLLLFIAGKLNSVLSKEAIRLTILFFTALLLLRSLPDHRNSYRYLLPGSAFTAIAWYGFSSVYGFYLHHISPGKLTGGLSNIAVTLLWLYFCMELLFLGALLCRLLYEKIPQD